MHVTEGEILKLTRKKTAKTVASLMTTLLIAGNSMAQGSNAEEKKVERVEVIGSNIRRVEVEGASPVTNITRQDLEKSGYNSVADVLRDTGANSFGSTREQSGLSGSAGNATVSLRGLGDTRTLVLLNGNRLPTDSANAAVDLNLIPMAAVERIEILKDGASAIYGSDALGGVVNIVTRKDFVGNEVSVKVSQPEKKGGDRKDISLVNGFKSGKLSVVSVLQVRDNSVIKSIDRPWSNEEYSLTGNPGSYKDSTGKWRVFTNCPADQQVTSSSGTRCRFNTSLFSTKLPAIRQYSLMSEAKYELDPTLQLTLRVGGTNREVKWAYAPTPGSFKIPAAVAGTLNGGGPLPGAPAGDLTVAFRTTGLGNREEKIISNSYNLLTGAEKQLSNGWVANASVSHSRIDTDSRGVDGYALASDVQSAIQSGALNPFSSSQNFSSIPKYETKSTRVSQLSTVDAKVTGELMQIGSSTLSMAMGASLGTELMNNTQDVPSQDGLVFGASAGVTSSGSRNNQALFTEFSLPLADDLLEIQLAGRYDRYSDFGDTLNPKLAVLVRPSKQLLIRTSAGTGFKAPLLQDLYRTMSEGFPTFIDKVLCSQDSTRCSPEQWFVQSGGNRNLKEERSVSYNAGVVYSPGSDLNLSADLFASKLTNVVGVDFEAVTAAELAGVNLSQYGISVTRDANGEIETLVAPDQNLASRELSGLDLAASLKIDRFNLSMEHSQMFYFKEQGFPGTEIKNALGNRGVPAWKNTASVGYTIDAAQVASLTAQTTAGQRSSVDGAEALKNYTELSLQYGYDAKEIGQFSAGVRNLLGSTPPIDTSNPNQQFDPTLYDQIGRSLIVGYKKTF